jgi:hypothetical protein
MLDGSTPSSGSSTASIKTGANSMQVKLQDINDSAGEPQLSNAGA